MVASAAGQPATPVGTVESVLATSRGLRLIVERAFAPNSYVVLPGESVDAVDVEGDQTPAQEPCAVRWVVTHRQPADLMAAGVFRRVLGRLTPDPLPAPALPTPDDRGARAQLEQSLVNDPLTAGGDLVVRVRHGVAILDGWLHLVAGKVQADRLARTTPGIWQARNRLVSDEELRVVVRNALRALPGAGRLVADFRLELGRAFVLIQGATTSADAEAARRATSAVRGIRAVELHPAA